MYMCIYIYIYFCRSLKNQVTEVLIL